MQKNHAKNHFLLLKKLINYIFFNGLKSQLSFEVAVGRGRRTGRRRAERWGGNKRKREMAKMAVRLRYIDSGSLRRFFFNFKDCFLVGVTTRREKTGFPETGF